MKNIYQDDSFNKEAEDIFSKMQNDLMAEAAPEKPRRDITADFTPGGIQVSEPSSENQRIVRPIRHAPPPIKRSAPAAANAQQNPQIPQPAQNPSYYPAGVPGYYPQPVYYQPDGNQPQPVFYQPDPNNPYPVYAVPGQPYPAYPQAAYPQQMPYQQNPAAPYQQTAPYTPVAAPSDPLSQEAGTRVLFQSPDFDKKEESSAKDEYETLPHDYNSFSKRIDVSEVELPSRKRAGEPTGTAAFKIDEMEIGTYELNAMSVSRNAKVTGIDTPSAPAEIPVAPRNLIEESNEEELIYDIPTGEDEAEAEEAEEAVAEEPIDNKGKKEKKKLSSGEKIRRIILGISVIAIIVSAYMLYNEYRLHKKNEETMNNISDLLITEPVTEPSTTAPPTTSGTETTKAEATTTTRPTTTQYLTPSEQLELLKKQNPDINFPANLQPKYAKLYLENQDFVGYLSAEGSDLDFPIVQGEDDEEYIEKDFFGEYTKYACPFMTSRNNIEVLDMNTVIYGHHMRDGSIFAALDQYTTLEGYKEAPVISFNTLYQDFDFKVIAVMITNINPEDDNGYVFPYYWTNLSSALNYNAYLNQLAQRSLYDTGVDVRPSDRLLTLSTCYSEFENARLVVVARLVRPGESKTVDTSKAVKNPNPRFPQAYYTENNKTNPYANAYRWEIT